MAGIWAEFCEQVNPEVLNESRRAQFKNANRIQTSFLSRIEKQTLVFLAERLPKWIHSDHLTALGLAGQIMVGVSYALSSGNRIWLIVGVGFLAVNWFGDSLDGTLAGIRQQQRPRYGFYVDHMLDSVGSVSLMGGLALSGYMRPYLAIGLLVGFLLLSIQSYLATYTLGAFRLSFWNFGPTELRILLVIGNLALLRWPKVLHAGYSLFNIGGMVGLIGMTAMLIFFTSRNTWRLYHEELLK
jgi:phosphatidylglycerophosphate synthase